MIGLIHGEVVLCPHEAEWEQNAAATIKRLKTLFGATAVDIRHVGSTAIPAIEAKPIVDIAVAVRSLDDLTPLLPALLAAGFHECPACANDSQRLFACGSYYEGGNIQTHFIHVVTADGIAWRDYCNFCNFMNAHPNEAHVYEQVKRDLAARFPHDRAAYVEGKGAYISRALVWAQAWSYLGERVTVAIDRPLGYIHKKERYTLTYPLNYGYLPHVIGGDGEELDVYVLGVDEPVKTFTGRVVAVLHRADDEEDKLVAAPEGATPDQAEIAAAVAFQEQYYHTSVEALHQASCGVIPYRRRAGEIELLLLFQRESQTWSMPKGHRECGETDEDTARREFLEEIGGTVPLVEGFCERVTYPLRAKGSKTVTLFLAHWDGDPSPRAGEIETFRWVSLDEAAALLHPEYAPILRRVAEFLKVTI